MRYDKNVVDFLRNILLWNYYKILFNIFRFVYDLYPILNQIWNNILDQLNVLILWNCVILFQLTNQWYFKNENQFKLKDAWNCLELMERGTTNIMVVVWWKIVERGNGKEIEMLWQTWLFWPDRKEWI